MNNTLLLWTDCIELSTSCILEKSSHLTAFCAWDSSPHLLVTPVCWWGLVLAEMHPVQWVTLCNIYGQFYKGDVALWLFLHRDYFSFNHKCLVARGHKQDLSYKACYTLNDATYLEAERWQASLRQWFMHTQSSHASVLGVVLKNYTMLRQTIICSHSFWNLTHSHGTFWKQVCLLHSIDSR